jgi:hypothetical protein
MGIKNILSKKYLPLIISLFAFFAAIFILTFFSLSQTGGHFFYTLDDPYIHAAIAKNLVANGTWGVTQFEFTSCSSSPLWGLIISFSYLVFGISDIIPFILNIIFASLTVIIIFKFVIKFTNNNILVTAVLLSVLFFGPFVSVVFTGLEHSFYSMIIILIAIYLYRIIDGQKDKKSVTIFFILLAMLTSTRYEGMFIAVPLFLIFLYRKYYVLALLIIPVAFLPILIMGMVSVSNGWYFLPNSVLLKSSISLTDFRSFIITIFTPRFLKLLWEYNRLFILIVISYTIFFIFRRDREKMALKSLIFLFVFITFLHIQFAKTGSLLRYEMYLIVLGIFINTILILKYFNDKKPNFKTRTIIFLSLLVIPFLISTYKAVNEVPTATKNIYQMQYQMSRFIGKYYEGHTIALNDVGAVNYYCNIHCVDLWGLANKEVAEFRRKKTYNPEKIYKINNEKNSEIAIVFDYWFDIYGGLPVQWKKAGEWEIPDNVTCGSDKIAFYATDSVNFIKLSNNLKIFSKELPIQVQQKGY